MSLSVRVGKVSDFPVNRTTGVTVEGHDLCIAHIDGRFSAFDLSCTHAAAPLSDSEIEEGQVTCPLHGARFDVTTGEAKTLPAVEPLKTYPVEIKGEDVFVSI